MDGAVVTNIRDLGVNCITSNFMPKQEKYWTKARHNGGSTWNA